MSHCVIEELPDDVDPTSWDKPLGEMLSKYEGESQKFLACVFNFLKRKTNFFKEGDAQKRVLEAFKEVAGDTSFKAGFLASSSNAAAASSSAPKPASAPAAPPAAASAPSQPAPTPAPAAAAPAAPVAAAPAAPASAPAAESKEQEKDEAGPSSSSAPAPGDASNAEELTDEKEESKGLKPNPGRGYDYGHYSFTQTLQEVSVSVPVPPGTKARGLDVVMTKTKLKVGLKGQKPIIEGELSEPIKPDDSMWNVEGGCVELSLTKQEGMHWWASVIKGDPLIDVHKVEPENSKLSDLDAETRQTVEKMMFDQRQKALGLPTSDELQRQEMLKKFMATHPEMDFSNAKIM